MGRAQCRLPGREQSRFAWSGLPVPLRGAESRYVRSGLPVPFRRAESRFVRSSLPIGRQACPFRSGRRSRGLSGRAESRPHYFKTIVQYLSTSPRDYGSHFDRVPFQDVDKSHISGWSSAAICLVWRTKTANNVIVKSTSL